MRKEEKIISADDFFSTRLLYIYTLVTRIDLSMTP